MPPPNKEITRDTRKGDAQDLQNRVRDLTELLDDRKAANVQLNAENQRLKRMLFDLNARISDVEAGRVSTRGEASSLSALRSTAANAKQNADSHAKNMNEALEINAQLNEEMDTMHADMEHMKVQLEEYQQAMAAAERDLQMERTKNEQTTQTIADLSSQQTALQQSLDESQKQAIRAQGLADQLKAENQSMQQQVASASQAAEQKLQAERAEHAAVLAKALQEEKAAGSNDAAAQIHAKDSTVNALLSKMQKALEISQLPSTLKVVTRPLDSTSSPAAADNVPNGIVSGQPLGHQQEDGGDTSNALEVLLHDAVFLPAAVNIDPTSFWGLLVLNCPGLGHQPLCCVPTSIMTSQKPVAPGTHTSLATSTQALPINTLYRLSFDADEVAQAVSILTKNSLQLSLFDARASLIGALSFPGEGADMSSNQNVVAVGTSYADDALCVELLAVDADCKPTMHLATLSTQWQGSLPQGMAALAPDEFTVLLRAGTVPAHPGSSAPSAPVQPPLHPLQIEAAKVSGLFEAAGRVVQATDGRTLQIWKLLPEAQRRSATSRRVDKDDLPLVPGFTAAPTCTATATLALALALTKPSVAKLESRAMRNLLNNNNNNNNNNNDNDNNINNNNNNAATASSPTATPLYDADCSNGTHELQLRDPVASNSAATIRLTVRLLRDLEAHGPLMRVLNGQVNAPAALAAQDPSAAPLPSALHWTSTMMAEQLAASQVLGEVQSAVEAVLGSFGALGAEPGVVDAGQKATMQALDVLNNESSTLGDSLSKCKAVAMSTKQPPHEVDLAHSLSGSVTLLAARQLGNCLDRVHLIHHLFGLGSYVCRLLATNPTDPTNPTNQPNPAVLVLLPPDKKLTCLTQLADGLQQCRQKALGDGAQLMALAASQEAAAQKSGGNTGPGSVQAVSITVVSTFQAAVDAAAEACNTANETARREIGEPRTDAVTAVQKAVQAITPVLASASVVLMRGWATVGVAAVASLAGEEETMSGLSRLVASLQQQGGSASKEGTVKAGGLTPRSSFSGAGVLSGWTASQPAPGSRPSTPGGQATSSAVLQQLSAVQTQVMSTALRLMRSEPAPVAPTPATAAAWLKSSQRLRNTMSTTVSAWSLMHAVAVAHAAVVAGQRTRGVLLMVESIGKEVERVVAGVQTQLSTLKMSKAFDASTIQSCMPTLSAVMTSLIISTIHTGYTLVTQLLLLPLLLSIGTASDSGQLRDLMYTPVLQDSLTQKVAVRSVSLAELAAAPAGSTSVPGAAAGQISVPLLANWTAKKCIVYLDTAALNAVPGAGAAGGDGSSFSLASAVQGAATSLGWRVKPMEGYLKDPATANMGMDALAGVAAKEGDVCVVVGAEQDAGTLVQLLSAKGMPILRSLDLASPAKVSHAEVAKVIVARVAVMLLKPHVSRVNGGSYSAAPLFAASYLSDGFKAHPVLQSAAEVRTRIAGALNNLTASFSATVGMDTSTKSISQQCFATLEQQHLLMEGILMGPSTAMGQAGGAGGGATPRVSLPGMPPRRPSFTGAAADQRTMPTPFGGQPTPPIGPAPAAALAPTPAHPEEEESNIRPLNADLLRKLNAAGDDTETESEAGSVPSASTMGIPGGLPAMRRRQ